MTLSKQITSYHDPAASHGACTAIPKLAPSDQPLMGLEMHIPSADRLKNDQLLSLSSAL